MMDLMRKIVKYGPLIIQLGYKEWHVGCIVRLISKKNLEAEVRYNDYNLQKALFELLKLAQEKHKELEIEDSKPIQQNLLNNYGKMGTKMDDDTR